MKLKILALIPARGGSKGLPRKNIKPLLGKPLIAWTIEQAKNSKYINRVVVSTDDEEIVRISKEYGAEVPFLRPKELARDDSPTIDAIMHTINWFKERGEFFDILVILEPTSPLRDTEDIDNCIEILLKNKDAESVVSMAKLESSHPEFNVILDEDGFIRKIDGSANFKVLRRQELTDVYYFDGSVYISYVKSLKKRKIFYHEKTLGYVVPKYKSPEIDDIMDFIIVEALMKAKLEGKL